MTWIPLSEALTNMLLFIEDQKREKEPQYFEQFKTAVVELPSTLRFLQPSRWKNQGTQYVCVRHTVAVREVSRNL